MRQVSIVDAKARFAEIIREAQSSGEVVITNRGVPVARILPMEPRRRPRVFGEFREQFEASGMTDAEIRRALEPMGEEELAAEGWPT